MVALNVKLRNDDDGFDWRNREWKVALSAKPGNANRNVKLRSDDGSDRRNRECDSDGSERQNWKRDEDDSEHQYWEVITMALNAERRCYDGPERRNRETRQWWLWNPKLKIWWGWLWTPTLRSDNDGSERRTKMWWWLWTLKPGNATMMALKAKTKNIMRMALNADTEKW